MKHNFAHYLLWALVLVCGAFFFAMPVQAAAQITVTTTSDTIADDAHCSLREAIIAANGDSAFHDCPAGSGADTIVFDALLPAPTIFTLTLTGTDENAAQAGDLDIAGALTISGISQAGADPLVIDGNQLDRVFEVLSGANVNMRGVTIRNGNPGVGANGGGVLVNLTARLTLTNCQVISSSALSGGGLYSVGGLTMSDSAVKNNQGGGITNDGGLLTLQNVMVANNTGGYGVRNQGQGALTFTGGLVSTNEGGIYNAGATASLSNLTIQSNTSGGLYNTGFGPTHATLTHSAVLSNTAISGAGVLNEGVGAKIDVIDSRISGNNASASGGGLFNNGGMVVRGSTIDHNGARAGAGIHHFGGNLSLSNDTISQNVANDNGGGLYNHASATLQFVTLNENDANGSGGNIFIDEASLSVGNTIVAQASVGGNCANSSGHLTSLGQNLESAATCDFTATGDLTNTNPLLGPLNDNDGPTPTHALLVASPAIDQGSTAACPATDQRGVIRPQGAACDIGAYEWSAADPTPTLVVLIEIEPPSPTVRDPISITVSGIYTTSCTPEYQAHQVTGDLIAIQSSLPDQSFCLPAEFPWGYTVRVGSLAAGTYTVTHALEGRTNSTIFTVTETSQCGVPASSLDQATEVAVEGESRYRMPFPSISLAPLQHFLPLIGNALAPPCR